MRTQMQRKHVANAMHLRRRISQREILFGFYKKTLVKCVKVQYNK